MWRHRVSDVFKFSRKPVTLGITVPSKKLFSTRILFRIPVCILLEITTFIKHSFLIDSLRYCQVYTTSRFEMEIIQVHKSSIKSIYSASSLGHYLIAVVLAKEYNCVGGNSIELGRPIYRLLVLVDEHVQTIPQLQCLLRIQDSTVFLVHSRSYRI